MRSKYARGGHNNVCQLIVLQNKLEIEYSIISVDQVVEIVVQISRY